MSAGDLTSIVVVCTHTLKYRYKSSKALSTGSESDTGVKILFFIKPSYCYYIATPSMCTSKQPPQHLFDYPQNDWHNESSGKPMFAWVKEYTSVWERISQTSMTAFNLTYLKLVFSALQPVGYLWVVIIRIDLQLFFSQVVFNYYSGVRLNKYYNKRALVRKPTKSPWCHCVSVD